MTIMSGVFVAGNSLHGVNKMMVADSKNGGFTLVELMVVLVILAVIATIGAPGLQTLIQRTKLSTYANDVVATVYLARSEAIKRNRQVSVCVSSDGNTCTGGTAWEQGWIVRDPTDPNDVVIKYQQALSSGILLFDEAASISSMAFDATGLADSAPILKLCQTNAAKGVAGRQVAVSRTGRTRINDATAGCP